MLCILWKAFCAAAEAGFITPRSAIRSRPRYQYLNGFKAYNKLENRARETCCKVAVVFSQKLRLIHSKHSKYSDFSRISAHILQYLGAPTPRSSSEILENSHLCCLQVNGATDVKQGGTDGIQQSISLNAGANLSSPCSLFCVPRGGPTERRSSLRVGLFTKTASLSIHNARCHAQSVALHPSE